MDGRAESEILGMNENSMDWDWDKADENNKEQRTDVLELSFENLPDEILENIFLRLSPYEDLDSVKQVCHRWNRVSKGTLPF
jgi:hypothetical protein